MYKVEIKEDKVLSKNVPFKRNRLVYFDDMEEVNDFLNEIKDEYSVINEREDRFAYFDSKTGCLMKVSVFSCRNIDVPNLNDNQVWTRSLSSIQCAREATIFDFYSFDDLKKFMDTRGM